ELQLTTDVSGTGSRHSPRAGSSDRQPAQPKSENRSTMSILDDLSSAIRSVHESAGAAVVGIGQGIRGSGVVIADGRVLTNAHNLRGDEVTVTSRDGRTERGTVRGVDPDGDLAVIDVNTTGASSV